MEKKLDLEHDIYPNVCYNKMCYKGAALYIIKTNILFFTVFQYMNIILKKKNQ